MVGIRLEQGGWWKNFEKLIMWSKYLMIGKIFVA